MPCDLCKKAVLQIFLFKFEYSTTTELTSEVYLSENVLSSHKWDQVFV
jgi:hypothetical protein